LSLVRTSMVTLVQLVLKVRIGYVQRCKLYSHLRGISSFLFQGWNIEEDRNYNTAFNIKNHKIR